MNLRRRPVRAAGFTLVELLIAIILMMILLTAITMVFVRTTDTVMTAEARVTVYTNARYALDMLENDLLGTLTFQAPPPPPPPPPAPPPPPPAQDLQEFWMENGHTNGPGSPVQFNTSGSDHIYNPSNKVAPADRISFRALTVAADTMQTVQVTWELIPSNFFLDAGGNLQRGDDSHQETVRTQRGLYTLIRRIRAADPNNPTRYTQMVKDSQGVDIPDSEMCHYVLGFNLEYMGVDQQWSQLEPSPFTSRRAPHPQDPLGNGQGPNDLDQTGGAYRVPAVRATLVIVDEIGERQERSFTKVMWIPVG